MKWHLNKDEEGLRVNQRSAGIVSQVMWESLEKPMPGMLAWFPQPMTNVCGGGTKVKERGGKWGHRQEWEKRHSGPLALTAIPRDRTDFFSGCFWSIRNHYFLHKMQTSWALESDRLQLLLCASNQVINCIWDLVFHMLGVMSCQVAGIQHATLMILCIYHSCWRECKSNEIQSASWEHPHALGYFPSQMLLLSGIRAN